MTIIFCHFPLNKKFPIKCFSFLKSLFPKGTNYNTNIKTKQKEERQKTSKLKIEEDKKDSKM